MTIGIISAMDSEHRRLVERLQDKNTSGDGSFRYVEGTLGGNHVILTQCGIGKVSAAVGASELIRRFSPDCIVSTGVAGGGYLRGAVLSTRGPGWTDHWCICWLSEPWQSSQVRQG